MFILAKSKWIFTGQQKANSEHLLAKPLSLPQSTGALDLLKKNKKDTKQVLFLTATACKPTELVQLQFYI